MKGSRQPDSKRTPVVFFSYILCVIAMMVLFQFGIDSRSVIFDREYLFIPEISLVRRFTFGFDNLIVDAYWLRCIQYAAEDQYSENGLEWLYKSLNLITTLDEKFKTAYLFGGVILSYDRSIVKRGISLLKKGMGKFPREWQFPFYIGFNYFFYLQEFDLAAKYIMDASHLPDSPPYLPLLASRLLAEARLPETALAFLENMYYQTNDTVLRQKIKERMKYVLVERDLAYLMKGVKRYYEFHGKYPDALDDLVKEKVVDTIPDEPFGGYYFLDGKTGMVRSSVVRKRLRLYRPDE